MHPHRPGSAGRVLASWLAGLCLVLPGCRGATGERVSVDEVSRHFPPLPVEQLQVQGLRRTVRFYRPDRLAERPAVVLALHGGGGDGERFRTFTDRAFERLADQHGFVVAYPDALGGQWNGCRLHAPHHEALSGLDELAFLRAVVRRAGEIAEREPAAAFVVGYSNGGHLVFRLALEAPREFAALAAIGAHLPVPDERDCDARGKPVPILLVSGTEDPINPWAGGEVEPPGGGRLGRVLSAESTAAYFARIAGLPPEPAIEPAPDRDVEDGTRVEKHRWVAGGRGEVVLLAVRGGGHALPHPTAQFPAAIVGRTSRDLDGAEEIWSFFARQMEEAS